MTLKELREQTGLSQSKFAKEAGISVRTYQSYEQGARDVCGADINTLLRICHVANCDLEEFITDETCREYYREMKTK